MVNVNRKQLEEDIESLEKDVELAGRRNWGTAHIPSLKRVLKVVKNDYGIQGRMEL